MIPLLHHFSLVEKKLPHLRLSACATPVEYLKEFSKTTDSKKIYIKRDDLSGTVYGGNKVRKLEFLLADAKNRGAKRVITSGAAGSNHCLATAVYAQQSGLGATLMLCGQPNSQSVRANLLTMHATGAQIRFCPSWEQLSQSLENECQKLQKTDGVSPYFIPPGGSSPVGAAGFVNAGFELAEQIRGGDIACPDRIFLPLGTMGTAAGLLLGLKAAGLAIPLHLVRVVPSFIANETAFGALFSQTNQYLHDLDSSFRIFTVNDEDCFFDHSQYGDGYGVPSSWGEVVREKLFGLEKIVLDLVYSAKAFAGLSLYASNFSAKETLLFWHTKNSKHLPERLNSADYSSLPLPLKDYFLQ